MLDTVAIATPAITQLDSYALVPFGRNGRPLDAAALSHGDYPLAPASLLYAAYCLSADTQGLAATQSDRAALSPQELIREPSRDQKFRRCPKPPFVTGSTPTHNPVANSQSGRVTPAAPMTELVQTDDMPQLQWAKTFQKPLDVLWGIGDDQPGVHVRGTFPELLDRLHGGNLNGSNGMTADYDRCRSARPETFPRLGRMGREALPIFAHVDDKPCPYIPSLPVTDLDGALTDDDKNLLIDNKVILIGGQYRKTGDWIPALETAVPGVQYHAMALANLIDFNADYHRREQAVFSGSSFVIASWPTFLAILAYQHRGDALHHGA